MTEELQPYRPIERILWATDKSPDYLTAEYGYDCFSDRWQVHSLKEANLVSSLTTRGTHAPILDIDYPATLEFYKDGTTASEYNDPTAARDGRPIFRPGKPAHYELSLPMMHGCPKCRCYEGATKALAGFEHLGFKLFPFSAHTLCLDLFFPAKLVESATKDHHHLYLDTEMDWDTYKSLLAVLAEYGLVQHGYASRSEQRGMSFLRYPADAKNDEIPAEGESAGKWGFLPVWQNPAWLKKYGEADLKEIPF